MSYTLLAEHKFLSISLPAFPLATTRHSLPWRVAEHCTWVRDILPNKPPEITVHARRFYPAGVAGKNRVNYFIRSVLPSNYRISISPLWMIFLLPWKKLTTSLMQYSVSHYHSSFSLTCIWVFDPGFSFSGEIREPFPAVIEALEKSLVPVTSVDAPSSWNIETGPPKSGPGKNFHPAALVSLTAPKPLISFFHGRHFLGGR